MYKLAIFLPLIGSACAALIDWTVKDRHAADRAAQVVTCLCMLVAGAISLPILRSFTGEGAHPRTDQADDPGDDRAQERQQNDGFVHLSPYRP